jgi:hypothetical protein
MTTNTRITLDASSLTPSAGSTLYFDVRSREPATTLFEIVLSATLAPAQGTNLGSSGFMHFVPALNDPLLLWSLSAPVAPLFVTSGAVATGTAASATFPLPANASGLPLCVQAVKLATPFPLSAPLWLKIL